ncbi:cytidyltransferase [Clostridium sp. PL3]|uniref:nicotinate-nucleotide adenylyltransferase n=1 Tax=Clostridium thailandense TaxID=2794346 RepID=A0A949TQ91_9CLOT|nr:cytidyltransferase [Clostridium thailandense]MBV7274577.1 cytidyltransferase [Clostridium thailandense]
MNNLSFIEVYNRIIRKLTSIKWLQKYNIEKKIIDEYVRNKDFSSALKDLIENMNFTAKGTLNICFPFLNKLAKENVPKDWLNYIYQYTLNKAFPETVSIDLLEELILPCELFLRIFRVICDIQKISSDGSFESLYPMNFLTLQEENELEHPEEYKKFIKAFKGNYTYEMMKINGELTGFTTLEHVCGVHYLSTVIARQAKAIGIPVDLGRVSGAAGGHDIGKYGCKGAELKRVPRLHYYYTDEWFKRYGINYIRNIAINHSTWDLELENLSLESLLLIYSDFRVKDEYINGKARMKVYSLEDSFYIILNKLENVNGEKSKRYKRVYAKLKNFEDFLINLGIDVEPKSKFTLINKGKPHYTLLQGEDIVKNLKYLSINDNINLMHQLRDEYSLDAIIEMARSEKDWKNLREYIRIFQEYSTYLTQKQKLQTIKFLYENLIHPEDDIRRHCSEIIGNLIAIYDEEYRKELPENVTVDTCSLCSLDLLQEYFELMLYPGHKVISSHRFNIGYSISIMVNSLFTNCRKRSYFKYYKDIIFSFYKDESYKGSDCELFLLETAKYIPLDAYDDDLDVIYSYVFSKLKKRSITTRLEALETMLHFIQELPTENPIIQKLRYYFSDITTKSKIPAENLLLYKINMSLNIKNNIEIFKHHCKLTQKNVTEIFLSNLKTATDWIRKRNQVELLLDYVLNNPQSSGLHTAIHFCNLLKVSAVESVRNRAGNAILKIMSQLTLAERNEVAVELIRALEIEGNKFTEYIPRYAGQAILWLQPKELDETISDCIVKIKSSNINLKSLILKTIAITISYYDLYQHRFEESEVSYNKRLNRMLGILLNGLGNYNFQVKQAAFSVIGKDIFGASYLDLRKKAFIFKLIAKKVLTLITSKKNSDLLFLTRSASLNHIYRFISDFNFFHGELVIPLPKKIAFFPGTFDPFSLSHKEIAKHIRDLGFEVYLAIDEFSWSKKTLPSLLRRNLVNMSISDELDIFIYPDILPTNIANPENLKVLRENFKESEVYIAIGSDVLLNASSYKLPRSENSIHTFSHIIFERGKSKKFNTAVKNIEKDIIVLTLSSKYSELSSTQIRSYIDENRDISSLVDPLSQQYIYDNGFYQRESQDKSIIKSPWLDTEVIDFFSTNVLETLSKCVPDANENFKDKLVSISSKPSARIMLLKNTITNEILGFSVFHWIRSATLYYEFRNSEVSQYIRENSVGRIIMIDGLYIKNCDKNTDLEQILLTETLTLCISKDYEYAIFKNTFDIEFCSKNVYNLLKENGFVKIPFCDEYCPVYAVNMSSPCILNLDVQNIIKEPFRSNPRIKSVLAASRKKLREAITELYPGELLISFDVNFVYQNVIRKICKENDVPTETVVPKKNGPAMCVPYGDILRRYVIPNTVTKSLHTEKLFYPDMRKFVIGEFPHYLDLKTQVKMIKSFNRPVILVDDLLHKGYRMKALDPIFKNEDVKVQKIIVGVLSGRGKDLMDIQNRQIDSVYFIPRLKIWFNENALYPFIGGDALWRGFYPERNLLPSINLILPYTYPAFIRKASKTSIYNLSKACIENSIRILEVLEDEFHTIHEKNLTLGSLGQVLTIPRCPEHGENVDYNLNLNPSSYLKNDLELLLRLSQAFE